MSDFKAKMHKIRLPLGLTPQLYLRGLLLREGEEEGGEGKGKAREEDGAREGRGKEEKGRSHLAHILA